MEKIDLPVPFRTIILDAGPIIHLDELGCLSLLSDFDELLVPAAVWEEVERHRPAALIGAVVPLTKIHAVAVQDYVFALRDAFNLDRGETEAISLCFAHPQALLLTDDAAVRLAVAASGLRAHGTIGILIRAVRRKQLTPAKVIEHLEAIPKKSTLFIKKSLLKQITEKLRTEHGL
jgi:predicted nucleic acid-binding protein